MTGTHEFGIALYAREQLEMLPELEKQFSLVEIPGTMLENPAGGLLLPTNSLVRDLCPRQVLNELPQVSQGVRNEFFRMFASRCVAMRQNSLCRGTIRVDFESISSDLSYADAYMEILRCCYGVALKHGISLGVELRIPGIGNQMWEYIRDFRRRSGCGFFVENDFHPHEPGSFDAVKELEGKMRFDSSLWRLSFDGASGNYPGGEVLRQIMNVSIRSSYALPAVVFAPGSGADIEVYRSVCTTVKELKQEMTK